MAKKKSVAIVLFLGGLFLCRLWPDQEPARPLAQGGIAVELGFDSVDGAFYQPRFRFDFPVSSLNLFNEIEYRQYADGQLRGTIDYWVNIGLERNMGSSLKLEARLNHMCRHYVSKIRPLTYELNELLGKLWWLKRGYRLAVGLGGFVGGTVDYRTLLTVNGEFPRIMGSPVTFWGEMKWVDFKTFFHQLELSVALSPGIDFIVTNGRDYGEESGSGLGIRLKSAAPAPDFFERLYFQSGILAADDLYKLLAQGGFWIRFFPQRAPRLRLGLDFKAPILRSEPFIGPTWPDKMIYELWLEYGIVVGKNLQVAWYGKYRADLPVDKDQVFDSDLGTGLALRNQPDFERLEKRIRYQIHAGFNFQHQYDLGIKWGVNTLRKNGWAGGLNLDFRLNHQRSALDARLFAEFGRVLRIRPFFALEIDTDQASGIGSQATRVIFGIGLFKWF